MRRRSVFFTKFSQQAENGLEAARALEHLFTDFTDVERKVRDLHAIEHYGDKLTREIVRNLNESFVTPLDREDIVGLASRLDDVIDATYDVSELVRLSGVDHVRPQAVRQVATLVASAAGVVDMIGGLEHLKTLEPHWIKIHTLENEGDQLYRDTVRELFASGTDAAEIIKWKDIHQLIELAIDKCEDLANIVEMIVIKQG